jgi:hypothetical protein
LAGEEALVARPGVEPSSDHLDASAQQRLEVGVLVRAGRDRNGKSAQQE